MVGQRFGNSGRAPGFFLAGAPKCGTSAMHMYLAEHPEVFMCFPKEPLFWSKDLPGLRVVKSLEEYMDLFKAASEQHRVLGDASAMYLYSEVALQNIRHFNPNAKIAVMLRNPVDVAYAYHGQLCLSGNDDIDDFELAWRLQEVRARGEHIPRRNRDPKLVQYREVARFDLQVERLFRYFPAEQVKIILFDDLVKSARDAYLDLLSFLDVPDDGRQEFPAVRQSRIHVIPALGRWLQNPPRSLLAANQVLKDILGIESTRVRYLVSRKVKRPPLAPSFRAELVEVFRGDVNRLSELLDRDLSAWHC